MSQIQFKCEKCGHSFYGVTVFQLHLAKCCQQDQLTAPVANVTEKIEERVEEKEKQICDEISTEDRVQETKNVLADIMSYLEEPMFNDLTGEVIKSREAVQKARTPLKPLDTGEDTEPIEYSITTSQPQPPPQEQRPAKPPPPVMRRNAVVGGSRLGGKVPFLQCIYCGKINSENISLARHMIANHWADVREAQGGGNFDNGNYYRSFIQDKKSKHTRAAPSRAKPYQRDPVVYRQPVEVNKKITNASRNSQDFVMRGKIPNKNLSPPVSCIDLTTSTSSNTSTTSTSCNITTSEKCDVCDDEFGWPVEGEEEHRKVCVRNRNKVQTPIPVVVTNTLRPVRKHLVEKKLNFRETKKTASTIQKQKYQKKKNQWKPGMEKLVKKISSSNSNIEIKLV